ncbi:MAG: HU family DNA-binding protein [Verrucomicrobiota bacterium]
MNKAELVEQIQSNLGDDTSKAAAERSLTAVLDAIKTSIASAGKEVKLSGDASKAEAVQLVGFGTFSVVRRDARSGHNPATGEAIKIKAAKNVKFKPGAGLKDLL